MKILTAELHYANIVENPQTIFTETVVSHPTLSCNTSTVWPVAAQAVRWPGIPMVARSRPSGCGKSCDLWLAFAPCNA